MRVSSSLDRQRQKFEANPGEAGAFAALEEHYFLDARWDQLVGLYRRRLGARDLQVGDPSDPAAAQARAQVLVRLAQVLEERCHRVDEAVDCYVDAARVAPSFGPALDRLRKVYTERQQWELVLQVGELRAEQGLAPAEMAALQTEMGRIWHDRLGDPQHALTLYERALEADPRHASALRGTAQAYEALDRPADASRAWERQIEIFCGPDRARALVAMAELSSRSLDDPGRSFELYRSALTEDPRNADALEALTQAATRREQWSLAADLQERRFELANGAIRRVAVALEAGQLYLDRLDDPRTARLWFRRALELHSDDPALHLAMADVERRQENSAALLEHLDRAAELAGDFTPVEIRVEAAELHTQNGDQARATEHLRRALERAADRKDVLDALLVAYERAGEHAELADLIESRAELEIDRPSIRAGLLIRLGELQEKELGEPEAAIDAFRRAFEADPGHPEAMAGIDRLYRKTEAWSDLRSFLEGARGVVPETERVPLLCSLGELLASEFDEVDAANLAFEEALDLDPSASRALQGLQSIALAAKDEDGILEAYSREATTTGDTERHAFLLWELVRRHESRGEIDAAVASLDALIAERPEDLEAHETRVRLRETLGDDDELIAAREAMDPLLSGRGRGENLKRLARVYARRGRKEDAIAAYEAAAEADSTDTEALQALLGPFEAAGRVRDLARIHRRLAELLPAPERNESLGELARLLADHLEDPDAAIVVLWRLVNEPGAPTAATERLEELLERTGRFEELAQRLLERRTGPDLTPESRLELDLRRASLLRSQLRQYEDAAALYREIRGAHPTCEEALVGLEASLRDCGDNERLTEVLEEVAAATADTELRAQRQLERAILLEDALGREDEALAAYSALLDADEDTAASAASRLQHLLERRGDWQALATYFEAGIRAASEDEAIALHERLAHLYDERMSDPESAIAHLEAVVERDPDRAGAWRSLAEHYAAQGRPREVLRAIEAELATHPEREREITLQARAGEICSRELEEWERAELHFSRTLELAPGHAQAVEYLAQRYAEQGDSDRLVEILQARLAKLIEDEGNRNAPRCLSLRLRIAALQADDRDDLAGAIQSLEPAIAGDDPPGPLARPLADLYVRAGRDDDALQLCQLAVARCLDASERADWNLRLANARKRRGDTHEAIEALREVLAVRPTDPVAHAELRGLYRDSGDAEPLARLLEAELALCAGREEVPLRLELAELLRGFLAKPADALVHLRRVLEIDPAISDALERGLTIAEQIGDHEAKLALLDVAIAQQPELVGRATHLHQRGIVLAEHLGRFAEAVDSYREALTLDPNRIEARRSLREALQRLGNWPAVLDGLHAESRVAQAEDRVMIFDEAARIAAEHISSDASLPWLERLRHERPHDWNVVKRIADIHRSTGRSEALLRILADQVALSHDPEQRSNLQLERSRILETDLDAPARAIEALEAARQDQPGEPRILEALDRLYTHTGRVRDRAGVLEARIEVAAPEDRTQLRCALAPLYLGPLDEPSRAAEHLEVAVKDADESGGAGASLLQSLGRALSAAGRVEAWARVAERELRALDPGKEVFAERRFEVRRELARRYQAELANPDAALVHLRAMVASGCPLPSEIGSEAMVAVEDALIDRLRAEGSDVELAQNLARRLEQRGNNLEDWLELARLREERLHEPTGALDAYRAALDCAADCRPAIRGMRRVAERTGDWAEVARSLELELANDTALSASQRAALYQRLGEVNWKELQSTTGASRSFASALESDPEDLESLRALESLYETMENWQGALQCCEREVELLRNESPDRTRTVLLRIAVIARDHMSDLHRSIAALEAAESIAALEPARRADLAQVYRRTGQLAKYVEVYAGWCDDAQVQAGAAEHVTLAHALEELERPEAALARAERALEADEGYGEAWQIVARLRETLRDSSGAAQALVRCAETSADAAGAVHLQRAAELLEASDGPRAAELLRRAVELDPAAAGAHAALARVAAALGQRELGEQAANQALNLANNSDTLDADSQLRAALVGARCALESGNLTKAACFATTARALAPDSPDALALDGEILFALGEADGARRALAARLALPGRNDERAHQLTLLGAALEATGDREQARERYAEALGIDPSAEAAHEGLVRTCERLDRLDEALAALLQWADRTRDPAVLATRLVRAAELELARGGDDTDAESHLRRALAADPTHSGACLLLTTRLIESGRSREALELSGATLERDIPDDDRARLALLRGRILEVEGDQRAAAAAYGVAACADPDAASPALAQARILRGLGEWSEAARALDEFARCNGNASNKENPALAQVHFQRGRLLAGPLEDVDAALDAYRAAIRMNPQFRDARESLATLLIHRPQCWDEAVSRLRELLDAEPTHLASLRGLLRIARMRGEELAVATGASVLRALGVASAEEIAEAPPRFPLRIATHPMLPGPVAERVRRMAHDARDEIARALHASPRPAAPNAAAEDGPIALFRSAALAAEGELAAPALVPLSTPEVEEILRLLGNFAVDVEQMTGDGHLVNELATALGRRARRRLRRLLAGVLVEEIANLDFHAWRADLRRLANTMALDAGDGDLRSALIALIQSGATGEQRSPGCEADLTSLVAGSPDASELLRAVVSAWIELF